MLEQCQQTFAQRLLPLEEALEAATIIDTSDPVLMSRYHHGVNAIKSSTVMQGKGLIKFLSMCETYQ